MGRVLVFILPKTTLEESCAHGTTNWSINYRHCGSINFDHSTGVHLDYRGRVKPLHTSMPNDNDPLRMNPRAN